MRRWALGLALTAPLFLFACFDEGSAVSSTGTGGTGGGSIPVGGGVGDECSTQKPCRPGLACESGVCAPGGTLTAGSPCVISGECQDGLQCAQGTCQSAGSGEAGDSCSGDLDCMSGLKCTLVGFSAQCAPEGSGDVGADCTTAADCFAGLACNQKKCGPPLPGMPSFGGSTWQGVDCEAPNPDSVRAYFEVPGVSDPAGQTGDFFRLPFPNDVRIEGGKVNLDGFPTPGDELLGFDPVQRYVDAVAASESGWSTYPTVIFRFSGPINFDTFKVKNNVSPVMWIDVTPGAPEYGDNAGLSWFASGGRSHYVCDNWFGVRRPQGAPLVPGHTYAVWMTTAGQSESGQPIARSPQLAALLASSAPGDAKLAQAYAKYKPFRDYLADKAIDQSTILNASVITASAVRDPMAALAAAEKAAGAPAVKSWVKCGGGAVSPCPDATGDRACGDGTADYDEYHALVSLPIFQNGTPPYETEGGDIAAAPVRTEDVCMALTVPKGAMPANGWPVVVFAHGTGGSFRSHIRPEVAGTLSKAETPSGAVGFAVLGIDQVQHGPRRGSSTASPDNLFFNFANPKAARGNPLQGAADQLALAQLAATLDVTAADTGGADIKTDANAVMFFGHSQGSTEGSLMLPYSDVYKAAVLSGNGASLIDALLNKTQPVNIKGALPFVLADFDSSGNLFGGDMHPVLGLLQQWIDPADPLNYAVAATRLPLTGMTPKHVFQTYGLDDHFSPPKTLATFALAARLELASHDPSVATPDAIAQLPEQAVPLAGNVTVGTDTVTLGVREYQNASGKDGHFVVFDVPSANADMARFLGMAAAGDVPAIGQ
ncbi:MAG: hypothetical protein KC776_29080 [Myxococcales bacterium]|nr:hypothetical protein [Myxococcales bacterium]MCB9580919.1 hypothetical protein [Polyangiaceae bacterium]